MKPLTVRQEQVLAFIVEHKARTGVPPTTRDIGAHLKIRSTNGVHDHLAALERKGFVRLVERGAQRWMRRIELVGERCPTCRGVGVLVGEHVAPPESFSIPDLEVT